MYCKLPLLTALAACITSVVSEDLGFPLFAYGKVAKSGLRLSYADGLAYIGGFPSFAKEAVNITLSLAEGDDKFVAKGNSTGTAPSLSSKPTMYVDVTEGASNPVGFTTDNETLPSGATAVGFGLYGGWVFHKQQNSSLEMKFIATPTNETGIFLVKWNAAATKASDDIAISLRTQVPVALYE
ncbi:hypothetical protein BU23DRAFT_108213 [Bimuria novae-zelandiae CBS 107.79]|uniref:Uncharacterized protein n=1 Tax=Bimuria novae-zelandiae CBS 107.79 TaxID=1447943 RepID=A0A6A5VVY7_9PLEO|nr:hypothetical protein BU23DRAFT_108213 [Bimuria novae-zelandiae CBS 107.79]